MPWIRLDDQFPDHPKVLAAGPLAAWLYVCGIGYCNRLLTDGLIPAGQVRKLADLDDATAMAARLVEVGLWEEVEGGYRVHDYLDYQPSREQALRTREVRAESGREGGVRSGEARRARREAKSNQSASGVASALLEANAKQNRTPYPSRTRSRSHPRGEG